MSEMGTGTELWPNLESRLTLTEKLQLVPKREVQAPRRQLVPVLESHWSKELDPMPKQARGLRWGWLAESRREAWWGQRWGVPMTLGLGLSRAQN